jgi:C-terminal processing protease CtpA/Prc
MAEMIERLNDDHSGFLTPEEVAEEEAAVSGTLDYVGSAFPLRCRGRRLRA